MMKFPKAKQKINKPSTPPGGIQLTARQLETKTQNWVILMCRLAKPACPPGGFWVESPEFRENSIIQYVVS